MRLKCILLAISFIGAISTGYENRNMVCINGICDNYADGIPIELYYLQNDSAITVGRDTLIHGRFNFTIKSNPDMAYYISVNDTQNPSRGMFFAEKEQ